MKNQKILLKDKVILALYVGCRGLNNEYTARLLIEARNSFQYQMDESSQLFVLADSLHDYPNARLECIHPKYLSEEEQNKLSRIFDEFTKSINHGQTRSEEK